MLKPVETHPYVQFSVWFVRNLKHNGASEQVQSHAGYLRNVIITSNNKMEIYFLESRMQLSLIAPKHHHFPTNPLNIHIVTLLYTTKTRLIPCVLQKSNSGEF